MGSARSEIRVALVGLGSMGLGIGRALATRPDVRLVAGVDLDPDKTGRDLGELLGGGRLDVAVGRDPAPAALGKPDVAYVTTTSLVEDLASIAEPLLRAGINVVTLAEEMGHPWRSHPEGSARLDEAARAGGVTVLGTGVNPGLVMDTLPILLSAALREVERIEIARTIDLAPYGGVVSKFGLGLPEEEFERRRREGSVVGHVGFAQSLAAMADALGLPVDEIEVDDVRPELVTSDERPGAARTLAPGTVAVVLHAARARRGGETVLELVERFGFVRAGDPFPLGDTWRLVGADQSLELRSEAGVASFASTIAIGANMLDAVLEAGPGLRTMSELPVRALASKGLRVRLAASAPA